LSSHDDTDVPVAWLFSKKNFKIIKIAMVLAFLSSLAWLPRLMCFGMVLFSAVYIKEPKQHP
jgi:hypothetical protein